MALPHCGRGARALVSYGFGSWLTTFRALPELKMQKFVIVDQGRKASLPILDAQTGTGARPAFAYLTTAVLEIWHLQCRLCPASGCIPESFWAADGSGGNTDGPQSLQRISGL